MHDDGMHHDGEENDNTYGALVPFFLNGENVKYYVRARDNDAIILNPRKAEREFFQYSIGSVPADGSVPTINEINYNSSDNFDPEDWVEIYNPTDSIFDIVVACAWAKHSNYINYRSKFWIKKLFKS